MTIKSKLVLIGLIPLVLGIVTAVSVYWTNKETLKARATFRSAQEITRNVFGLNLALDQYLRRPEERPRVQFQALLASLKKTLVQGKLETEQERNLVQSMGQSHQAMGELFSMLVSDREKDRSGEGKRDLPVLRERIADQLLANSRDIVSRAEGLSRVSAARLNTVRERGFNFILLTILISALGSSILVYRIGKGILKPLQLLRKGTEAISKGDLNQSIALESKDEVGQLSKAFNEMSDRLKTSYASIDDLKWAITERQQAEEALRESEARLRTLGDNLPDSMVYQYVHELDGTARFLYVSAGVERLNGVRVEDVVRDAGTLHRQFAPEDRERLIEAEACSKRDLSDFDMEVPMRRSDGEVRWMHLHSRPRRLPDGRTAWDGVQTDITARKQAEAEREANRLLLDAAIQHTPAVIALFSGPEFEFEVINAAYQQLAPGKQIHSLKLREVWPEVYETIGPIFQRVYETGEPFSVVDQELEIRRSPDGPLEKGYFTWSLQRVKLPGRDDWGLLNTAIETTASKRAEAALRESEMRHRRIYECGMVGILYWDMSGAIDDANDKFLDLVGYTREELLAGKVNWAAMTPPEYKPLDDAALAQLRASGIDTPYEKEYIRKDGSRIHIFVGAAMLDAQKGVAFVLDITERKQAEAALTAVHARLETVMQTAQVAICVAHDPQCRHITGNEMAHALLGVPLDRNISATAGDAPAPYRVLRDGRDCPGEELPMQAAARTNRAISDTELEIVRADGQRAIILCTAAPLCDPTGEVTGAVGTFLNITARKQAEAALRDSEEKFRTALAHAQTTVFTQDTNLRYTWHYNAHQGFSNVTIIGRTDAELLPAEDAQVLTAIKQVVLRTGIGRREEVRTIIGNEPFYYDLVVEPTRAADGTITGIIGSAANVTERRRAEAALRASEERLALAAGGTGIGFFYREVDKREIMATEQNVRLLGLPLATTTTTTALSQHYTFSDWAKLVHPEDLQRINAEMDRCLAEHKPFDYEYRVVWPDGSVHWLATRGIFQNDDQGASTRLLGINMDITERKRAEQEREELLKKLEEKSSQLEAVLANMAEAVGIWSADGHLILLNEATLKLYGFETKEQMLKHLSEYAEVTVRTLDGRDLPQEEWPPARALRGESFSNWWLIQEIPSRGLKFVGSNSGAPIRDANGKIVLAVNTVHDVTELYEAGEALQQRTLELKQLTEKLEERVRERTAELTELSAQMVSAQENERKRISYDLHDQVWQTLGFIRLEIEDLFAAADRMDRGPLQDKARKLMKVIQDTIGKIRSMQGDLWPYVLDDIGLLATIDWYGREFQKDHPDLTIERKADLAESEIPAPVKIVIYRILKEALSNVANHSQANRVLLGLSKKDRRLEFTVADNGLGFDLEQTMVKRSPWGGLGLLNIKARTELSGGLFGVETGAGKGTTVKASWAF